MVFTPEKCTPGEIYTFFLNPEIFTQEKCKRFPDWLIPMRSFPDTYAERFTEKCTRLVFTPEIFTLRDGVINPFQNTPISMIHMSKKTFWS